jgi:drug/metabolite transporter (DMT)-like permease
MIDTQIQRYAFTALAAAALFGASTPLAKLMLGGASPQLVAGLLYAGSGVGLLLLALLRRNARKAMAFHLPLRDAPWLAGAILSGGVLAPVLLMWGLTHTSAASASLMLNLEGVLTTVMAAWVFHEAVGVRIYAACALMLLAGALLSWQPGAGLSLHALAVMAACLLWALDNNLTRQVSANDPVWLALIKGMVAGVINLGLATLHGATWPGGFTVVAAMGVGFLGYGVSLVLFILALRHLGTARTAAHFGTAPFLGAAIGWLGFGEPLSCALIVALLLMFVAAWLVLHEKHEHVHTHEPITHTHEHRHDEHHQHTHADGIDAREPHTHEHHHEPLTHTHPHLPDIHHRHPHG